MPPNVILWGGFVGAESIGVVATASEPGRVFCNAFPVNGTQRTVITGTLVREPNFFAILTLSGTSVFVGIGDLTPETEYEAEKNDLS